jgi:hypothetical protein
VDSLPESHMAAELRPQKASGSSLATPSRPVQATLRAGPALERPQVATQLPARSSSLHTVLRAVDKGTTAGRAKAATVMEPKATATAVTMGTTQDGIHGVLSLYSTMASPSLPCPYRPPPLPPRPAPKPPGLGPVTDLSPI